MFIKFFINGSSVYEERIVAVKAESYCEAIKKAEKEGVVYAECSGGQLLNYVQCYHAKEWLDAEVSEIYSLLRDSDMSSDEYLDRFEDTGFERSKVIKAKGLE